MRVPSPLVRRDTAVGRAIVQHRGWEGAMHELDAAAPLPDGFGINLIGYFSADNGLGNTARAFAEALRRYRVPFSIVNVGGSRGVADTARRRYQCRLARALRTRPGGGAPSRQPLRRDRGFRHHPRTALAAGPRGASTWPCCGGKPRCCRRPGYRLSPGSMRSSRARPSSPTSRPINCRWCPSSGADTRCRYRPTFGRIEAGSGWRETPSS